MNADTVQYGKYQHYKTKKLYEVIGMAKHSETLEEMVIYQALHKCDTFGHNQVWVRSKTMFFEQVHFNEQSVPRFKLIDES